MRRLFMAGGWQVWKRLVRTPIIIPLFNGFRFRAYPDCQASSAVLYTRIPNFRCLSFLRKHIERGTFLDIGANVGLISLLLADKIQHAILFEPNPAAAARARENLALNHLGFEVQEVALSDQAGTVEIENAGGVDSCNRTVVGFTTSLPTISCAAQYLRQFLGGAKHSSCSHCSGQNRRRGPRELRAARDVEFPRLRSPEAGDVRIPAADQSGGNAGIVFSSGLSGHGTQGRITGMDDTTSIAAARPVCLSGRTGG